MYILNRFFHTLEPMDKSTLPVYRAFDVENKKVANLVSKNLPFYYFKIANGKLIINGFPVSLSPKELKLMQYLCSCLNRLVDNQELYEEIWSKKYTHTKQPFLSNLILRVRKKVTDEFGITDSIITNQKGKGYVISSNFILKND
jgi:DNA-binding response OmpR family regulator